MTRTIYSLCFLLGFGAAGGTFASDHAVENTGHLANLDRQASDCTWGKDWPATDEFICDLESWDTAESISEPRERSDIGTEPLVAQDSMASPVPASLVEGGDYWYDVQTGRYHDFDFVVIASDEKCAEPPAKSAEKETDSQQVAIVESAGPARESESSGTAAYAFDDFTWDMACDAYRQSQVAWKWLVTEADRAAAMEATVDADDWEAELEGYCNLQMEEAVELELVALMQGASEAVPQNAEIVEQVATAETPSAAQEVAIDWDAELAALLDAELAEATEFAWASEIEADRARQAEVASMAPQSQVSDQQAIQALASTLDQLGNVLKGMSNQLNAMAVPQTAQVTTGSETAKR